MRCRLTASVTGCGSKGGKRWLSTCKITVAFGVDIHPAATIGCGIMLDHATGIVIGETAVVENNVSILQSVTLAVPVKPAATVTRKSAKG